MRRLAKEKRKKNGPAKGIDALRHPLVLCIRHKLHKVRAAVTDREHRGVLPAGPGD